MSNPNESEFVRGLRAAWSAAKAAKTAHEADNAEDMADGAGDACDAISEMIDNAASAAQSNGTGRDALREALETIRKLFVIDLTACGGIEINLYADADEISNAVMMADDALATPPAETGSMVTCRACNGTGSQDPNITTPDPCGECQGEGAVTAETGSGATCRARILGKDVDDLLHQARETEECSAAVGRLIAQAHATLHDMLAVMSDEPAIRASVKETSPPIRWEKYGPFGLIDILTNPRQAAQYQELLSRRPDLAALYSLRPVYADPDTTTATSGQAVAQETAAIFQHMIHGVWVDVSWVEYDQLSFMVPEDRRRVLYTHPVPNAASVRVQAPSLEKAIARLEKKRRIYVEFSEPGFDNRRNSKAKADALQEAIGIVRALQTPHASREGRADGE